MITRAPRAATVRFEREVVRVSVGSATTAALRLESDPPWLRVALCGRSLAWACPAADWQSLAWIGCAVEGSLGIVAPLRTSDRPAANWPSYFAHALLRSDRSPLNAGEWELRELRSAVSNTGARALVAADGSRPATGAHAALVAPPQRLLRWVHGSSPNVVALRTASDAEAPRVRAWRKRARLGSLPPMLLLWMSSIDGYAILDGHDRLRAASLEDTPLGAVALYTVRDRAPDPRWMASALRAHAHAFAEERHLHPATAIALNHALTESHRPGRDDTSVARYVPGLAGRFAAEHPASALAPEVREALRRP